MNPRGPGVGRVCLHESPLWVGEDVREKWQARGGVLEAEKWNLVRVWEGSGQGLQAEGREDPQWRVECSETGEPAPERQQRG